VVMDHGSGRNEAGFSFTELTDTQKGDLQDFFDDDAEGLSNSFQVVDHHGTLWTAYFLSPELGWTNIGEKTLGGTDAVWSLNVRLELEATS